MYRSQTPEETLAKARQLLMGAEIYWTHRVAQREAIEAYLRRAGDVKQPIRPAVVPS